MDKIGRNDPCPCGSGRKYKKCCLAQGQRDRSQPQATPPSRGSASSPVGLGPYVIARIFERSEAYETMLREDPKRAMRYWTPSRLAALATDEIEARLRALGVTTNREAFAGLTVGQWSAWATSEVWRKALEDRDLSRHDHDFLGLAACELWKRYCPDRPSMEMLDDWMQEGYEHSMAGHAAEACETWWHLWEVLQQRLTPQMTDLSRAEKLVKGTQCLFNWMGDFSMELVNAGVRDPTWAERGARLLEAVLARFTDEDEETRLCYRLDLGSLLFSADQVDRGEEVLRGVIRDYPDRACGYAYLADAWSAGFRRSPSLADLDRALTLLEQARALPVVDGPDFDLDLRVQGLKEMMSGERVPGAPAVRS